MAVFPGELPSFMPIIMQILVLILFRFADLVRDITTVTKNYNCNDAAKWFAQVLQYNVPRGKKNRGILTVLTYKNLVPAQDLTPENIKLAQYLGWCVEMVGI